VAQRKRKAGKAAARSAGLLWMRLGDNAGYEEFGLDFDAAALAAAEAGVRVIESWDSVGFESANFRGNNYVSLYWGGLGFERALDQSERLEFQKALKRAAKECRRKR